MSEHDASATAPVVSFADEPLILVDSDDQVLGHMPKAEAHEGAGVRHRAFSIFLFNSRGELLIQQRSPDKQLWGGYWANSCCSHPRRGEAVDEAATRRLAEELGVRSGLEYLYRFEYHAQFGEIGAEHELCSVYAGCSDDTASVNQNEIAAVEWIGADTLDAALADDPERYSPWLKLEWPRIRAQHWPAVQRLIQAG